MKGILDHYVQILVDRNYEPIDEYFTFCLNYVQKHIIYQYDNKNPTDDVITELFKRGMIEKWKLDKENKK